MGNKMMQKYYRYMRETGDLKVGTYEALQLGNECGIDAKILIFLGLRATATQAPIAIKDGWYIYDIEERIVNKKTTYYITIDNALKYI